MVVTFVISNNPIDTFKILDVKRLGKQRLEAQMIIQILEGKKTNGYINHPMTKMWDGYVGGLKHYFNLCIDEWVRRGYKNKMEKYTDDTSGASALWSGKPDLGGSISEVLPWWFFNSQIHETMKASLIRKDEDYYSSKISLKIDRIYEIRIYLDK